MIRPFGEFGLLVETGSAARAQRLAAILRASAVSGVAGVVAGLESLLVELDPAVADLDRVRSTVEEHAERATDEPLTGRPLTIPVAYGGEHGPDLAEVAAIAGLSEADVVERHASAQFTVLFLGFAPGFAYLGGLPGELRVPRLATPRTVTPAGSVAIAEGMSGIYPADLPGGWRVIGRTALELFDPRRDPPALLAPGDVVRFEPIGP